MTKGFVDFFRGTVFIALLQRVVHVCAAGLHACTHSSSTKGHFPGSDETSIAAVRDMSMAVLAARVRCAVFGVRCSVCGVRCAVRGVHACTCVQGLVPTCYAEILHHERT